jgi:formamidopyrimidine-DNA glycosylase
VPELPDVEGFRRVLADHAAGREVRAVTVPDQELLEGTTPQGLGQALRDRRLAEPRRHGKWLFGPTEDGPILLFHFRMTGELVWAADGEGHPHDRVVLRFDEGELRYREQRRLGRLWLLSGEAEVAEVTGPLGPDAREVDRNRLRELLTATRAMLKSALMDQRRLAGVGNELSDEVLWDGRLNPRTRTDELSEADLDRLHRSVQRIIEQSIEAGRIPEEPGWLESQRGADDPRCPRCGTALRRETVAGRTAYWCPSCQPG